MRDGSMTKHTPTAADRRFDEWNYACRTCGSPYRSKLAICYDCGSATVVSIDRVLADADR